MTYVDSNLNVVGNIDASGVVSSNNGKMILIQGSPQSIPSNSNIVVTFNEAVANTFGTALKYNKGNFTNTSGIVMWLLITYSFIGVNMPAIESQFTGYIQVNGEGPYYGQMVTTGTNAIDRGVCGTTIVNLGPGNFFQVYAWQTSGSTVNISSNSTYLVSSICIYQLV